MPVCDAGYVRGAPYPSPSLGIGAGTRRSLAASEDSDVWRSRFVDLPATAAVRKQTSRNDSSHVGIESTIELYFYKCKCKSMCITL